MHLPDEGAEEAKIVVRSGAQRGAVGGAMHVGNVRADGEMDGDGNAAFVGVNEDAGLRVLDRDDAAREELPGGFAVADAGAVGKFGDFVDVLAGLRGHAEPAFAEAGFDVFRSVAGKSDFKVMDERGAIHGDAGDEAALHEIDQDRAEADLDDVAADAPQNGPTLFAGGVDGAEEPAKIFSGEDV